MKLEHAITWLYISHVWIRTYIDSLILKTMIYKYYLQIAESHFDPTSSILTLF